MSEAECLAALPMDLRAALLQQHRERRRRVECDLMLLRESLEEKGWGFLVCVFCSDFLSPCMLSSRSSFVSLGKYERGAD
jgi:hypothetical protein